jgi:Co/Zn/Cd efflux system component
MAYVIILYLQLFYVIHDIQYRRIEVVTSMVNGGILSGLSASIVIEAVAEFIHLDPMTHPFVVFVVGAVCLAMGSALRVASFSSREIRSLMRDRNAEAVAEAAAEAPAATGDGHHHQRESLREQNASSDKKPKEPSAFATPQSEPMTCEVEDSQDSQASKFREESIPKFSIPKLLSIWVSQANRSYRHKSQKQHKHKKLQETFRSQSLLVLDYSNTIGDIGVTLAAFLI